MITGKGPEKEKYLKDIANLNLQKCYIRTAFLPSEDYPRILGASDLGISLHQSSSQLDLPMKVLDMFGTGLPVLARHYPCLEELVQVNKNGLTFTDDLQLYIHLKQLFKNDTGRNKILEMRKFIEGDIANNRWDNTWTNIAQPILLNSRKKIELNFIVFPNKAVLFLLRFF